MRYTHYREQQDAVKRLARAFKPVSGEVPAPSEKPST
jgi:hypothetical protein